MKKLFIFAFCLAVFGFSYGQGNRYSGSGSGVGVKSTSQNSGSDSSQNARNNFVTENHGLIIISIISIGLLLGVAGKKIRSKFFLKTSFPKDYKPDWKWEKVLTNDYSDFQESDKPFVKRVFELFEQNTGFELKNPIYRLDKFSKDVGMGHANLFYKLKGIFGMSFQKLYIRYKLELVKRDLSDTDLSIGEIADKYGYTKYSLSKAFKQNFGLTPTEYRKKNQI